MVRWRWTNPINVYEVAQKQHLQHQQPLAGIFVVPEDEFACLLDIFSAPVSLNMRDYLIGWQTCSNWYLHM